MNKNKRRGTDLERRVVKAAEEHGLKAKRAFASDGRAMGMDAEVDVVVEGYAVQCKKVKKLASRFQIPKSCDIVVFCEDRKQPKVMMPLEDYLEFLELKRFGPGDGCYWEGQRVRKDHEWYTNGKEDVCHQCGKRRPHESRT